MLVLRLVLALTAVVVMCFPAARDSSPLSREYRRDIRHVKIDFTKSDWPNELLGTENVSGYEGWGRWTDGRPARFVYKGPLPAKLEIRLEFGCGRASSGDQVLISIGADSQAVPVLTCEKNEASIVLVNPKRLNEIQIHPSFIYLPAQHGESNDFRRLGISLFSLEVRDVS